jgi:hypothetical protein
MEIEIFKYNGKDQKNTSKSYPILDYKMVNPTTNLLLIQESQMGVDHGKGKETEQSDFIQICKIQFIAACRIEIAESVLVAFYLGEGGELYPFVLSGLPLNYSQGELYGVLIDYQAYSDICEITQENKLSIYEYYQHIKDGDLSLNSLMFYNGNVLNKDAQNALWAEIDEKK